MAKPSITQEVILPKCPIKKNGAFSPKFLYTSPKPLLELKLV